MHKRKRERIRKKSGGEIERSRAMRLPIWPEEAHVCGSQGSAGVWDTAALSSRGVDNYGKCDDYEGSRRSSTAARAEGGAARRDLGSHGGDRRGGNSHGDGFRWRGSWLEWIRQRSGFNIGAEDCHQLGKPCLVQQGLTDEALARGWQSSPRTATTRRCEWLDDEGDFEIVGRGSDGADEDEGGTVVKVVIHGYVSGGCGDCDVAGRR
ncbi:putative proline-rich receptor-like protein kinase PERK3 [Iris pallida]|uniref:Proline-rich receptor-like protein kinase PERK3 n=1 Tax=Iris pallida TaxID=29817 RepID=A0AAX6FV55_IRIPA|nr:putative proline-rich receptor-like protein kinase PERK3 [Iris pallida]